MSKPRPTSASSRMAWHDQTGGHARPDSQFDFDNDGIRDDADLGVSAMHNDSVYMGGDKGKGKAVAPKSGGKNKGFLGKIGGGIRSLWATRQTEDMQGDRELHVKTTLRELIVYIVFLVILCIVTFGMTSTTMYYYTKVMNDLFLDTTTTSGGSFRTITSVEDFWKFAKQPLLNGLYWETWYNNDTVPQDQLGYIYYENKLLGVPRLRQLQVASNSCTVHPDFQEVIRECYESYAESLENKEPFGPQNNNYTAWYYRTQDELDGSNHWGQIATYSGAGFVQDLKSNKSESQAIIDYLFDNRWIQRGTRVVFIDFTVYNANINLFCVIRLSVEFPPTGGAISHATMRTVKLIRYVTVFDYFILACEFIFCLFIIYYMIEEAIEIKKHKLSYFKSFWNILDIIVIGISIVCVAFNVYRTIKVEEMLQELLNKPNQYPDFEFLSYGQTQFDNAIAIVVFFAWIKIFKYISFNKTMTQLSSTLGKCAKDLAGFAVMFFIIFLAFTQLGYLLFGTQVKEFSNFQNSFFTLFRIILGDFDFDQLEAANRVLGPLFFMLFVFFVFFVLINMFLAIINDTYSEVKGDMANQKNEFEMTDYFKRGYEKMLSKLNFKHDKIVDIQKALHSADINNDKQVDFDEWRQDLKTRGYADGEIEALFAKYDLDGDRVLDEEEQKRMQADLNDQKDALNKEYDNLDKMGNRPESAHRSTSRVSFNDDSADESDDDDSHAKSSRSGPSQSVSYEEFTVLSRRVDRMEHSIGSIVSKIDAVLVKLEAMEKAKLKRRETMGKILDSITESDGTSDEVKREQMERLVREELERWDSESSITPQPSNRGASPSSSGMGGPRSRSRPGSGGNTRLPVSGDDIMLRQVLPARFMSTQNISQSDLQDNLKTEVDMCEHERTVGAQSLEGGDGAGQWDGCLDNIIQCDPPVEGECLPAGGPDSQTILPNMCRETSLSDGTMGDQLKSGVEQSLQGQDVDVAAQSVSTHFAHKPAKWNIVRSVSRDFVKGTHEEAADVKLLKMSTGTIIQSSAVSYENAVNSLPRNKSNVAGSVNFQKSNVPLSVRFPRSVNIPVGKGSQKNKTDLFNDSDFKTVKLTAHDLIVHKSSKGDDCPNLRPVDFRRMNDNNNTTSTPAVVKANENISNDSYTKQVKKASHNSDNDTAPHLPKRAPHQLINVPIPPFPASALSRDCLATIPAVPPHGHQVPLVRPADAHTRESTSTISYV